LIDAVVALLIAALAAGTVLASLGIVVRHAGKARDRALASIETRNADAERKLNADENE
jgi:hypothetical protein